MIWQWLFGTRQRLLQTPVSDRELDWLARSLWQSRYLTKNQLHKLVRWCRVFQAEKNWEGCSGLTVTEEIRWGVSAAAGLMVLEYDDWYFDRTQTILVYPEPYVALEDGRSSLLNSNMPAIMGEFARAGQTIYRGPVIVNWTDVCDAKEGDNAGNHLVIHEFAHQLDMINSTSADGLPPLPEHVDAQKWQSMFRREFQAARGMVEQGYRVLINDYGLTQESEFFAVASEYYFQTPHQLAQYHPNLFRLLLDFYRLDLREFVPAP